jgi:hypothetical protein
MQINTKRKKLQGLTAEKNQQRTRANRGKARLRIAKSNAVRVAKSRISHGERSDMPTFKKVITLTSPKKSTFF